MGRMLAVRFWHGLIVIVGVTVGGLRRDPADQRPGQRDAAARGQRRGAGRLRRRSSGSTGRSRRSSSTSSATSPASISGRRSGSDRPALTIVMEHLPITLLLVGDLGGVRHPGGDPARRRSRRAGPGGWVDRVTVVLSLVGAVGPAVLARAAADPVVRRHARGAADVGGAGSAAHLVLPALTLAIPTLARLVDGDALADDRRAERAVRAHARGQGLSTWRVVAVHALRNAGVPVADAGRVGVHPHALPATRWWSRRSSPGRGSAGWRCRRSSAQDLILVQAIVLTIAVIVVAVQPAGRLRLQGDRSADPARN